MSPSTGTRRAVFGSPRAAAGTAAAAFPAHAREERIPSESARATTWVNGGVGKEQEAPMCKIARGWPLHMIFAERKDDECAADVDVQAKDRRGAPVLPVHDAGPMRYAMLPAGKCRIGARFHGIAEARDVALDGKTGSEVCFHGSGTAKVEPWDGKPIGGKQIRG